MLFQIGINIPKVRIDPAHLEDIWFHRYGDRGNQFYLVVKRFYKVVFGVWFWFQH